MWIADLPLAVLKLRRSVLPSMATKSSAPQITVRWEETTQKYQVINGGRRFQAAVQLGVVELHCWIQQTAGKQLLIDQVVHSHSGKRISSLRSKSNSLQS